MAEAVRGQPSGPSVRDVGLGALSILPDHVISYVTFLLDVEDAARLACVSRVLRVFASEEPLWLGLCLKIHDGPIEYKTNWRQTALASYAANAAKAAAAVTSAAPPHPAAGPATSNGAAGASPGDGTAAAQPRWRPIPPEVVESAAQPLQPLQGLDSIFLYRRWYRGHVDLRGFLPPPPMLPTPAAAESAATHGAHAERPAKHRKLGGQGEGAASIAGTDGAADQPQGPSGGGLLPQRVPGDVPRLDARGMAPEDFHRLLDGRCLPALLTGLTEGWPVASWSLPALCVRFPSALFKVAKPHGGRGLMTLPAYTDYMARQADEEPLYIFDPTFAEAAPGMRSMYDVPAVFRGEYGSDCMSHLRASRPPYRWLVLGPARSGASWHVDPNLTSAWNSLLSGRKRWALYPPERPPPGVALVDDGLETSPDDALTSLQWFMEVYPQLPPHMRPLEFVQEPGETVYVPGGWWHCVLNLDTSVAVTQNYVSYGNLERVVRYMAYGSSAYHADPLPYYSREEVAAWAAHFPQLVTERWTEVMQQQEEGEGGEQGEQQGRKRGRGQKEGKRQLSGRPGEGGKGEHGQEGQGEQPGGMRVVDVRPWDPHVARQLGAAVPAVAGAASGNGSSVDPDAAVGKTADGNGRHIGGDSSGGGGGGRGGVSPLCDLDSMPGALSVWRRERGLGTFLRLLWAHEERARPLLQDCLARHLHADSWAAFLQAVLGPHGPAHTQQQQQRQQQQGGSGAPRQGNGHGPAERDTGAADSGGAAGGLELVPLVGADALVFQHGHVAVKVFTHEDPRLRSLMCAVEWHVPRLLLQPAGPPAGQHPGSSGAPPQPPLAQCLPQPLACGTAVVGWKPHGDAAAAQGGAGEASSMEDEEGCHGERQGKHGLEQGEQGAAGEVEVQEELPYLVASRLQGSYVLSDLWEELSPEQRLAASEALGDLVGRLHAAAAAAPPPTLPSLEAAGGRPTRGSVPRGVSPSDWGQLLAGRAFWHDREGRVWVQGEGCVCSMHGGEHKGGEEQGQNGVGQVANGGGAGQEGQGGGGAAGPGVGDAWWPFVACLRRQRADLAAKRHEMQDASLPRWMYGSLEQYLPEDPAVLLGYGSGGAGHGAAAMQQEARGPGGGGEGGSPGAAPLLLHGDVTSNNVVFAQAGVGSNSSSPGGRSDGPSEFPNAEPAHANGEGGTQHTGHGACCGDDTLPPVVHGTAPPQLQIVDFSDAGYGDPLYELVPVLGSCLHCHAPCMQRFWSSYRRHVDVRRLWPSYRSGVKLSYVAMCYSLLHDEAEVLLKRWGQREEERKRAVVAREGLAAVAAGIRTLEELGAELWGFLDEDTGGGGGAAA